MKQQYAIKPLLNGKKGNIQLTSNIIIGVLVLIVIVIACFLVFNSLQNAGMFTANSVYANNTNNIIANATQLPVSFASQLPTVGVILGVVLLLTVIGFLIFIVLRFRSAAGGTGAGL